MVQHELGVSDGAEPVNMNNVTRLRFTVTAVFSQAAAPARARRGELAASDRETRHEAAGRYCGGIVQFTLTTFVVTCGNATPSRL